MKLPKLTPPAWYILVTVPTLIIVFLVTFDIKQEAEAASGVVSLELQPVEMLQSAFAKRQENKAQLANRWINAFDQLDHNLPIEVRLARGNYIETVQHVYLMSNRGSLITIRFKKPNYDDHSVTITLVTDILGITNNP